MLEKIKEYKELAWLIGAVAGVALFFTPMSYAKKTREMVVMFTDAQQLKWMTADRRDWERDCTDKKTDEWLCSDSKRDTYDTLKLNIELLRIKLGLPAEGEMK